MERSVSALQTGAGGGYSSTKCSVANAGIDAAESAAPVVEGLTQARPRIATEHFVDE